MWTPDGAWLLTFTGFLLVVLGYSATLSVVVGLMCGWRMRTLSFRRGLVIGVIVGVIAFFLNVGAVLVNAVGLAMILLPIPPAITLLLCWRMGREPVARLG